MKQAVNVFSPGWEIQDSYGRIAIELSRALTRLGYHVNRCGGNPPKHQAIQTVLGGFLLAYPTNFEHYGILASMGPRVAVTMFESTQLPPGWADVLNEMQAVIVPSRWMIDAFRDSGVKVPLHCIPLGVSGQFKPVKREVPKDRPYRFLVIADRGRRKGWDIAGRAFPKYWMDDPNVELWLKCRPDTLGFHVTNPNIRIIEKDLSNRKMASLYAQTDCMVFPTMGEGFGLPPREYAATGGPVIATNFGGTADDIAHWGYPLYAETQPAWSKDPNFEGLGLWAKPSVDDVADAMLHVYRNHAVYLERGAAAAKFVRKAYRWSAFGAACARIWQEALSGYGHPAHTLSA
jgi:hypothetical protein